MKKILALIMVIGLAACAGGSDAPSDVPLDANGNPIVFVGEGAPIGEPMTQFEGTVQNDAAGEAPVNQLPQNNEIATQINKKWFASNVETKYEEYRGRMVRVQVLMSDSDVKEMRLRLMPKSDGGEAIGNSAEIIKAVADYSAKRICGKNAKSVNIVYEQNSFDSVRPTPFFDYKVDSGSAASTKEYGFICQY
jgi:hypothetical protein